MSAVKEHSGAGFILFAPDFKFLLVQDAKTKKWGFPKGHREPMDTDDLSTAQRELTEETGLLPEDYTVFESPFRIVRGSSSYIFRYAMLKSEKSQHLIRFPPSEISGIEWFSLASWYMNSPVDGNKYLRTWISDILIGAQRRSVSVFQAFLAATFSGVPGGALGVGGEGGEVTDNVLTAPSPVFNL